MSYADMQITVTVRVSCDSCQLLRINGVVCHETGRRNSGGRWHVDREEWVKYVKCFNCGYEVESGTHCDCQDFDGEDNDYGLDEDAA